MSQEHETQIELFKADPESFIQQEIQRTWDSKQNFPTDDPEKKEVFRAQNLARGLPSRITYYLIQGGFSLQHGMDLLHFTIREITTFLGKVDIDEAALQELSRDLDTRVRATLEVQLRQGLS
jgi:hypothetical protein